MLTLIVERLPECTFLQPVIWHTDAAGAAHPIFPTLTGRDHAPDADDGDGGLMLPF